ncbi:hypothetical protein C3L33_02404, partial [Rhododendron williamsianum]
MASPAPSPLPPHAATAANAYSSVGKWIGIICRLLRLISKVMQDDITMDFDERHFHGKPQNSFHKAVNIPDVVVFPR